VHVHERAEESWVDVGQAVQLGVAGEVAGALGRGRWVIGGLSRSVVYAGRISTSEPEPPRTATIAVVCECAVAGALEVIIAIAASTTAVRTDTIRCVASQVDRCRR
jgi:hypothetical protein